MFSKREIEEIACHAVQLLVIFTFFWMADTGNPTKGAKPMSKDKTGQVVKTEAVISSIEAGVHEETLSFGTLCIPAKETVKTTDMVHRESQILLNIDLPQPDPNFPPIEAKCMLANYKTNAKCDKPSVKHLRLSTDQIAQIAGYVRAAQDVIVTFTEINPGLPFDAKAKAENED
jgi:hypothetical protein